jgi:pimeloyl-ACP methyl ester carboxylesterase
MRGADGPGPSRYDRVRVLRIGSSSARHVLVLLPGTSAGAGYFVPVAEDLVAALHGWQVWAVDRRENLLEAHAVLDRARAGAVGGQDLFDYYLGWIANPAIAQHYQPPADERVAFARRWGMRVAVNDVARVVRAARAGGRHVVLGGHSLGGWIATAYAAWDFGGRAGARDLDGLVLIDGASGAPAISPADARRDRAGLTVHCDPLFDDPASNDFLATVVPFLERIH